MVRNTREVEAELERFRAQETIARRNAVSELRTRVTGTMLMRAGGFRIHIDREVDFSRETDGTWLICLYRTDPEAVALIEHDACDSVCASLEIRDATICAFLDRFAAFMADPAGQAARFPPKPDQDDAGEDAA